MIVYLITLVLCLFSLRMIDCQRHNQCCQEYCFDSDNERTQAGHFGFLTPYSIAKGPESGRQYLVPNCSPTKIWLLIRHGTSLPEANSLNRFIELEDLRREIVFNYERRFTKPDVGALCDNDLELLKKWQWNRNITADIEQYLTVQGWDELKLLAIRYQRILPNILENIYDGPRFSFRYTNTQHSEASYKAFVEGLFGLNAHEYINVTPSPLNDTLLQAYKLCPAYESPTINGTEYEAYLNSPTMIQLVNDVSQRLGFRYPLKLQQILDMFDMCRRNLAYDLENPSPWCVAFTPSQVEDIEYSEDLYYYYQSGYGKRLNSRIECAAVNDMLKNLNSQNEPRSVVYLTEPDSLLLFLTAMGIAKDAIDLTANNYQSMSKRKWRTSEILPFAANFAAIKYDCPREIEREKIMFFLNEKPLKFDWCRVGLCDLNELKQRYKRYTEHDCEQIFCNNATSHAVKVDTMFTALFIKTVALINVMAYSLNLI